MPTGVQVDTTTIDSGGSKARFMQTPIPTFTGKLERIITPQRFKSPFKMLGSSIVRRFQLDLSTPGGSCGPSARQDSAPSDSKPSSEGGAGGTETPTKAARVVHPLTWFATK